MGLRDFLLGAQQFQQGAQAFGQASASQKLREELPTLLQEFESGTDEQKYKAASRAQDLAQASGETNPYVTEMAKVLFQKQKASGQVKESDKPQSLESLRVGFGDANEQQLEFAAGLPTLSAQQKYMQDQGVRARSEKGFGFRATESGQKQENTAFSVLNKTKDAFRADEYKLKEITQAMDNKTTLNDSLVFGYIARAVAQEKGPLSDSDISRIQGIVGFQGTRDKFMSFFTGDVYTSLSEDQRKAVRSVVERSARNFNQRKAESMAQDLNDLYHSQARLKDKEGNPVGILKSTLTELERSGVPVSFDKETKSFVVKKQTKQYTGEAKNMIDLANSVQDPKMKAQAAAIIKAKGENLTADDVSTFKQYLKSKGFIKE